MKKLFNIEIKETISDIFEIEAESSGEAEYLAEKGYYDGEYILDGLNEQKRKFNCIDINSPMYISNQRKEQILTELLDYVFEHSTDEKDYYNSLKNIIGLTDSEMTELGIDVKRQLKEITPLQSSEIEFEDELLIEDEKINAYIPLYNIDIFEKFNLKQREDSEYNLYLDYDIQKEKSNITIIEKNDVGDIEYEYETSDVENQMLKEKLDKYCMQRYKQSLKEMIEEEREI